MLEFQYILCCGSTENRISGIPLPSLFQYILCCGSTGFYDSIIITSYNFNTSYVAVQLDLLLKHLNTTLNFNTSYVAVQL